MKSIVAILATTAWLAAACGAEVPSDSAGTGGSPTEAVAASDDHELDCSSDQREEMVADFGNDPYGGYETPEIALRSYVEHESRGNDWPPAQDFKPHERDVSESDFVIFDYVEDNRRLAVVWARDLGRSWLVTAHAFCKEAFD